REFVMSNRVSGNFVMMLSRLWFDRWSTMLTVSYSTTTNHAARPTIVYDEADGAVPVRDRRGTLAIGIASSVWLGKKKRWGIDLEYIQPIPDGRRPENAFYYLAGDTNPDPDAVPIGAWSLGGSYSTGKHFFQIFISNNRQIHLNQAVPGGQAVNPFRTPCAGSPSPAPPPRRAARPARTGHAGGTNDRPKGSRRAPRRSRPAGGRDVGHVTWDLARWNARADLGSLWRRADRRGRAPVR